MANILEYAKEAHGWSQAELSRRMGFGNRSYISNLKTGENLMSIRQVQKFAEVLGVPYKFLIRDRG